MNYGQTGNRPDPIAMLQVSDPQSYLRLVVEQRWGRRGLERQVKRALFERVVLAPLRVSPVVRQSGAMTMASVPRFL
jgi:hypothetical protein